MQSKMRTERVGEKSSPDGCGTRDARIKKILEESTAELTRQLLADDVENKGRSTKKASLTSMLHSVKAAIAPSTEKESRSSDASESQKKSEPKNHLTQLIPGYTAPMHLESDLDALIKSNADYLYHHKSSVKKDVDAYADRAKNRALASAMMTPSSGPSSAASYPKKSTDAPHPNSHAAFGGAGKGWFGMGRSVESDSLESDLRVVRMRNYIDPKKFYKAADDRHKSGIVQMGTVIEGNGIGSSSARLTRRERKANLTEEVMGDMKVQKYLKKKNTEIHTKNSSGNKKWYKKQQDRKYRSKKKLI